MANSAADVLLDVLQDWGVEVIFGLPGDGINGIMEALRKRQEEIRFVQVRHEESAAPRPRKWHSAFRRIGFTTPPLTGAPEAP